ncbi:MULTISPECIES: oligosaccharyl transferase, archaeosortase A system-associated [unclassified Archaeoglobus]|jgi:dolichyl-diphosphooligosaccharide--protein glycosyltransferase|uniref:oligosaccharyl transferase, archaeosortase A system-associated n=1 Tax=unclassified Archaeoglobus TaxID=2643606 RepID=UPI0025B84166|nr:MULTISPECIES: oligosaccharyl transferase, archaeosortase A system-associated [unclassified Archaeoglobus]
MQNAKGIFEKYWHVPILIIAFVISIKLRVFNPWDSVFTWTVRLGGNDPWYYYRLIENTIHNFPFRIWFDPFTHYPYGSYTHFGPFLVYLGSIAGIISGTTSGEELRAVLAFLPVIGGVLTIIPTYILAREVFGKNVAVVAAFFAAFIPGQFLQRSMLGFNDHHVWEVFWMIATLAAFSYSFNRWKESEKWFERKNLFLAAATGIIYGLYIDTWAPAFAFGLIFIGSLYISLILRNRITIPVNILPLAALIFLFSALIYAPFAFSAPHFSTTRYSPLQLIMLVFYALVILILWQLDVKYSKATKGLREAILIVPGLILFVVLPLAAPDLFGQISRILHVVQPKGGALTVAEVHPFFFTYNGDFTLTNAFLHFGTLFFFAFPGIIYAAYRFIKNKSFLEFNLLIWAVAMFIALWGQNRFAYYFAIVTAVYSALVLSILFEKLHLYKAIKSASGFKEKYSKARVVFAVLIALFAIYPTYSLANIESVSSGGPQKQWYDALSWMRENTPNGDKYDDFYYELYPIPESNKEPFNYPFETYGVISWWDYGHWIETIAHRMPIANPFQHGIGNKYNNVPGASAFFTAFNESYAEWIAEQLNVRYVVSDVEMETGKFYAMAVWAEGDSPLAEKYYGGFMYISGGGVVGFAKSQWDVPPNSVLVPVRIPSEFYFKTMEARLHLFDGSGLSHYRMIYESGLPSDWVRYRSLYGKNMNESEVLRFAITEAYQRALYGLSPTMGTQEIIFKYTYNKLYSSKLDIPHVKLEPSGYVKIFERVKGAIVTGKVDGNVTKVVINATIVTNQNRTFEYYATAKVENGVYSVILPYSHDSDYPVKPITPYHIRAGNVVKTITLTENQVVSGETVVVDLV